MKNRLRRGLINFLAKHLYKTITDDDLLKQHNGAMYVGGKKLTAETMEVLIQEAGKLRNSTLWKLLKLDLQHHAIQKTLHRSETMDDVVAGKLLMYLVDVIEQRLKSIEKGK